MNNFFVQETPGKVFAFLGIAMFSMAFMFGVSVSNASFNGTEVAVYDTFGPQKAMAILDNVSKSYSDFLAVNLLNPLKENYATIAETSSWVAGNAKDALAGIMPAQQTQTVAVANSTAGRVAGAETTRYVGGQSLGIDQLYSLLIQ